jgi:endoglucanase
MQAFRFSSWALARLAPVVALLITTPVALSHPSNTLARPSPTPRGYWHTRGTSIVDSTGAVVRIAGVTWYGMESTRWVPAGLDYQSYTSILSLVKTLGYNTIRLPFSNELVERNPVVTQHIKANPQFAGVHALTVLDDLVAYAGTLGLKVILDDQISVAETPDMVNNLNEPLWYTSAYPQSAWIHDWQTLARRYKGDSTVIGFDLRNEPHTSGPGPWSLHTYLHQGSTWGPYRGVDDPARDWRLAAEKAGNAVLAINPHLLIFVEGVQLYPDASQPRGVSTGWWGWNLSMVPRYPIILKVKHHLVYSPHDWGPHKHAMGWFPHMTYASMTKIWHDKWAFLLDKPAAAYAAPVLLGEFGTCTNRPQCVDRVRQGNQAQWLHFLLRFLKQHPTVGWDFFALNGTNANNALANNGLLAPTWDRVANQKLQDDLATIQP